MKVICERDPDLTGVVIVRPRGRLDTPGSGEFWEAVRGEIDEAFPSVLLDLKEVKYMTSVGVGTLIRLLTRTQRLGGALVITGVSSRVRAILKVMNLESRLDLATGEEEARSHLRERAVGG